MHSKSENIKIMMSNEANQVIKQFFQSLKKRCQNKLG